MGSPYTAWVRGAGELGSACALSLHRVGIGVFVSEIEQPLAIRRTVTFSDAMYDVTAHVEDVKATLCTPEQVAEVAGHGELPILIDDPTLIVDRLKPDIIIDARMTKRGDDLRIYAPISIGLGPGFSGGGNCDAAIETKRGHDLGRILWDRSTIPNTGEPGLVGGEKKRRLVHSPGAGMVEWRSDFGDIVDESDVIGTVGGQAIKAPLAGQVRGMIHPRTPVEQGTKIGDIDPRGSEVDPYATSDKAHAIGRAVLEAVFILARRQGLER